MPPAAAKRKTKYSGASPATSDREPESPNHKRAKPSELEAIDSDDEKAALSAEQDEMMKLPAVVAAPPAAVKPEPSSMPVTPTAAAACVAAAMASMPVNPTLVKIREALAQTGVTESVNDPLFTLDEQMNIVLPDLSPLPGNKPCINVSSNAKNYGGKAMVFNDIKYVRKQFYKIGPGPRSWKMKFMTPFALARNIDPLPLGSYRNRWNDPQSSDYREHTEFGHPELRQSKLAFRLMNDPLEGSGATNVAFDQWLDMLHSAQVQALEALVEVLPKAFPSINSSVTKDKKSTMFMNASLAQVLEQRTKFLEVAPKEGEAHVRALHFSQELFTYASENQQNALRSVDFRSRSGNEEITKMLRESLEVIPKNSTQQKPMPMIDQPLRIFRMLSAKEVEVNPEAHPFVEMTPAQEATLFGSGRESVVSVAFELVLDTNREGDKVVFKSKVLGILWYGWADIFTNDVQIKNASKIVFPHAPNVE